MLQLSAKALFQTNLYGDFDIFVATEEESRNDHIILIKGKIKNDATVLCRICSECITGMALDSSSCDCEQQLRFSMSLINEKKSGVLIFLRQEGRGHGLATKIRALANKNKGDDTFRAVENLGLPADARDYSIVPKIFDLIGLKRIDLISSNPQKIDSLTSAGILIERSIATPLFLTSDNRIHLEAKIKRGHFFKEC